MIDQNENYFARVDVRPPIITTSEPPKRSRAPYIVFAVICVLAVGFFFVQHSQGSNSSNHTPTVLPAKPATAGLPGSLGDVVRMQAESTRRLAIQAIGQGGDFRTQSGLNWVVGNQPSTDPHTVSYATVGGVATVAVAATNHDICAFGRVASGSAPEYVTMAHVKNCTATAAPTDGWSAEAGGAASDLPDDNG